MSSDESEVQHTQHAFLVVWGWFGEHIGLIQRLLAVRLHQKRYHHTPQGKVLEFLVAILAGLKHLQDISLSPIRWTGTRRWHEPGDKRTGPTTAG